MQVYSSNKKSHHRFPVSLLTLTVVIFTRKRYGNLKQFILTYKTKTITTKVLLITPFLFVFYWILFEKLFFYAVDLSRLFSIKRDRKKPTCQYSTCDPSANKFI